MEQHPAKIVMAILTNDNTLLNRVIKELSDHCGSVDYQSVSYPFGHTMYYEDEMGLGLTRTLVSFERLDFPEMFHGLKEETAAIEDRYRQSGDRQINIDAGYLDYNKFVLFSGKHGGHKIAIKPGIYADMVLYYGKGEWHPFPWSFPDFKVDTYHADLTKIRRLFKKQMLA